jgi:hypothetical protein
MRGFNEKLFGDKLVAGQLPTQLGLIGSQSTFIGLLDTYPNAAVAYSIRKLTAAYNGNAIRVRRSSDNAEQDIGFSGSGDLDTSALTSFCGASNGFVTTWYDQSGNLKNATQTTAGNQPQIVSSGSYLGYIQNLTASAGQLLNSTYQYTTSTGFTSFMTVQNNGAMVFGGTEGDFFYNVAQSGSGDPSFFLFTTPTLFDNGVSMGTTRGNMHTATTSFSVIAALSSCTATKKLALGFYAASSFNNGRYKEVVIYDNQTVSRTGVESNTMTYYGI